MMSAKDILVITCAASPRQGAAFIPLLIKHFSLRLIVNSLSSLERLQKTYPESEVIQADITSFSDCQRILIGAQSVLHIGPSLHPREAEMGINMIEAAVIEASRQGSNFKHFVFSSVLNTQLRKLFNHDRKRYVEEYLVESGLNYTIASPGDFLNMAVPIKLLLETNAPTIACPMGLDSASAFVVLEDLAEAITKILVEGAMHYGAHYQLCSTRNVTYGAVMEEASKQILEKTGKNMPVQQMPLEQAIEFLCHVLAQSVGEVEASPRQRDGVERLVMFYRRRGLPGNPNVLRWLLGRDPTDYREWIARQLEDAS